MRKDREDFSDNPGMVLLDDNHNGRLAYHSAFVSDLIPNQGAVWGAMYARVAVSFVLPL